VTAAPAQARPPVPAASWQAAAGLTFLAVAVGLCTETLSAGSTPTHAVVWGALAVTAEAAGLLCLMEGNRAGSGLKLAMWKLGPCTLIWYGLTFGIASLTWIQPQSGTAVEILITSVLRALWLVAVGMLFWAIGYFIGCGRAVQGYASRAVAALSRYYGTEVRSAAAPWILYAIGFAARIGAAASTGRFGYVGDASSAVSTATYYGQVLNLLSLLAPLAVAAAALQVFRERVPRARITLAVLFLAELIYGAASGGKEDFIIAVLAVIIPISVTRYRIPKLAMIAGILAFLLIVIPFNQAYRNAARGNAQTLTASQAINQAPEIFRETLSGQSVATVLPDSVVYLLQRLREIDGPAIIMQRSGSQIPFSSPALLIEAPLADIMPRAIWTNKPILATGYQFGQEYYNLPTTVYSSSAITPIGDLYRHGGWIPVMVGMVLLGCVANLLDRVLDVRTNPHAIFLVLLIFPAFVKGEDDWITLLAGIPGTLLIWLFAVAVIFGPRQSLSRRST
jgi:hypothetical protein